MEITKKYWRRGEIADELGLKSCALYYWEEYFGRIHTRRDKRGARMYDAKARDVFIEINRLLKVELYTLAGAKKQLGDRIRKNARA